MHFQTNGTDYELDTIVLDLNGTLAVYGEIQASTIQHLQQLQDQGRKTILLTGNQRGNAHEYEQYGLQIAIARDAAAKAAFVQTLDTAKVVAIGNARIDIGMFQNTAVSIATLQAEGIHASIINHVDIIVPSIDHALQLFLDPNAFAATMKV